MSFPSYVFNAFPPKNALEFTANCALIGGTFPIWITYEVAKHGGALVLGGIADGIENLVFEYKWHKEEKKKHPELHQHGFFKSHKKETTPAVHQEPALVSKVR